MAIEFTTAADYLLDEANIEQIARDFDLYFRTYTGRYFEQLAARSSPNRFTAHDLCAAASLSVAFTGEAAADLLIKRGDYFNSLLNDGVPGFSADLRTVDEDALTDDSPLAILYAELKTLDQVGYVRASKLLAAKRPGLVPIRDSVGSLVQASAGGTRTESSPGWTALPSASSHFPPGPLHKSHFYAGSTSPCGWREAGSRTISTDRQHRTAAQTLSAQAPNGASGATARRCADGATVLVTGGRNGWRLA